MAVVRFLCSRVLTMLRGEIIEQGNTEDVFAQPRHPYTRALLAAASAT
jgi:peptide/nickel transport system ATP-binding protein